MLNLYTRMAQLLSKFRIQCQDMKIIPDIGKLPSEKRYSNIERVESEKDPKWY